MRLRVNRQTLALERWPFDGLRVALVSDLHAGGPGIGLTAVEAVVARVNAERPDLVALLGDYTDPTVVDGARIAPSLVVERLRAFQAPAFAVLGNHDWLHEGPRAEHALRDARITVLENASAELRPGLPAGAAVLLLSHDPDVFDRVPPRVALTLSGHTHGGQVHVPLLWRLWTPARYRAGHVVQDGRHLFVTSGVGFSRRAIRWRVPSEIAVLTLRGGAARRGTPSVR
jgi:uncharacterized protein